MPINKYGTNIIEPAVTIIEQKECFPLTSMFSLHVENEDGIHHSIWNLLFYMCCKYMKFLYYKIPIIQLYNYKTCIKNK